MTRSRMTNKKYFRLADIIETCEVSEAFIRTLERERLIQPMRRRGMKLYSLDQVDRVRVARILIGEMGVNLAGVEVRPSTCVNKLSPSGASLPMPCAGWCLVFNALQFAARTCSSTQPLHYLQSRSSGKRPAAAPTSTECLTWQPTFALTTREP